MTTQMQTRPSADFQFLALGNIQPSALNPRKTFDESALAELAASIREKGVLQPVVVRPKGDGFELVAGERRYRASLLAEQTEIPAIVRELDDKQVLEIMVIENAQRVDVHPLEEADAFLHLISEHDYTEETISAKLGKSVQYIRGRLVLSGLTDDPRAALLEGVLPLGHAQIIARLDEAHQDKALTYCGIAKRSKGFEVTAWSGSVESQKNLRNWVKGNFTHELSRAEWDLKDKTLVPIAGACSTCQKRTGINKSLFPELEADVCTDSTCWKDKGKAFLDRNAAKAKESNLPVLSHSFSSAPKGALSYAKWNKCDEKAPDAKKGIIVETGEEIFFRLSSSNQAQSEEARKRELETKIDLAARPMILAAIIAKVREIYEGEQLGDIAGEQRILHKLCRELFVAVGTNSYQVDICKALGVPVPKDEKKKPIAANAFDVADFDPMSALAALAFYKGIGDSWNRWEQAQAFAKSLDIDLASIWKSVKAQVTAPNPEKAKKGKKEEQA